MIKLKSFLVEPILKSSIPLLFGGSFHLLKDLFSRSFQNTLNSGSFLQPQDVTQLKLLQDQEMIASSEGTILDGMSFLNQISFGVYSNLFAFFFVMLLIDLFIKIAQNGIQGFWKEIQLSRIARAKGDRIFHISSENQITRIFSYVLIFLSLQMIGFGLSFAQNQISLNHSTLTSSFSQLQMREQEEFRNIPRILEEAVENKPQSLLSSPMTTIMPDKISLSMGNVLSSLSLSVKAMILSKDKKLAFVTIDFYGTLHVIDISDLQSPFILGSLNLELSTYSFQIKSLVLSSDEKTLYISNSKDLEIVDVTDPSSLRRISWTPSEIITMGTVTSRFYKTSLALSESTKTLYIGGLGLQIYDISNPEKPVLIKAIKNDRDQEKGLNRNEICLSRDEKVLFVANHTLDVYNVSNPREMKLIYSNKTESSPRSIMLSEDFQTAFLLGTNEDSDTIFEEVDISSPDSLKIKSTIPLGHKSNNSPRFLAISPSKSKFFILADSKVPGLDLLVFDRLKKTTIKNEKSLIEETFALDFGRDGKTLITASNGQFMTLELFLDYPNSRIFSISQNNIINTIPLARQCRRMVLSDDGQYLFILRDQSGENMKAVFEIWDVKNVNELKVLDSYTFEKGIFHMHLTKNYETAYLFNEEMMYVLDIRSKSSVSLKKTLTPASRNEGFDYFITSSDAKTGFLVTNRAGSWDLNFVDLSKDTSTLEGFVKLDFGSKVFNSGILLKDDDKTLIVLNREIAIYNISNLLSPVKLTNLSLSVNEAQPYFSSYTLSPDNKMLFLVTFEQSGFQKMRTYNISNLTSIELISEKYFSANEDRTSQPEIKFSSDLRTGFVFNEGALVKLDMTNLKEMKISGIISFPERIFNYAFSPDRQIIYASSRRGVLIINSQIQYTMFLKREKFLLGEKYSDSTGILNMTDSEYHLVDTEGYKVIKLSLLDIKTSPNKAKVEIATSILPSWISFDSETNTLTVEPKKQKEIGTYTLQTTFSLKIPNEAFENLGTAEHPLSSQDLWAWLISLDYVDPQLYLTANFRSLDTFILPTNFSDHREDIYKILKGHLVETCTAFDVVSSLEFHKELLQVSSISTGSIKVEIKLEPEEGVEAKFVNIPYGSLMPAFKDSNRTKIALEGINFREINTALSSVIVNFENGTESDGNFVINDGLNPPISARVNNISRYFKANRAPYLKKNNTEKTIQQQIDNANIQTGVYFTFGFSENSFGDDFAENLNYHFAMASNNTAFPSWLDPSGLTLKGTPPEEIFGRDLDMVLFAKNEFKQFGVPFKLQIKMSPAFYLKLAIRFSPYILTILGLFVGANKIFNILRKKYYKHPKEFYVGVGEEIGPNVIFPITFIKEEQKQSQLIWKQMGNININDFIGLSEHVLEKGKIIAAIKEVTQKMPVGIKKQLTHYPSPIIDQIIINKFVWMQLASHDEMRTCNLFNALKHDLLEAVGRDSSGFRIDSNKLSKLVRVVRKLPEKSGESLEESLIRNDLFIPGVNLDLLKDAVLAFAFESHSICLDPIDVDIGIKQRISANMLWRFLKLDLRDIYLNDKNKINYGLNYQIIGDKLCFYGVAQENLKGKTLVVQVKNTQHRMLKEIWIHGVGNLGQNDELEVIRDEPEARGQGYEVY